VILGKTDQVFSEGVHAMTAPHFIDPARFLSEQLEQASPDLMRQMLTTFINALMSAEAEAVCGAEYGQISADWVNSRNG
jgi:putative transposase